MILDGLAEALLRQERTAELYAMLEEATKNYGASHDYIRQAVYIGRSGDADGAVVAFRKAAFFAPADDPTPFLAAADYYESIGDNPQAVTALRNALYVKKNDPAIGARLREHGVIPGPAAELQPIRE
jgi:Flp pilus assembly protein TadD